MDLVIGCPIYKRSWIFPYWISCIERQDINLSKVGFVFEASPDDEPTLQMMQRFKDANPQIPLFDINIREDISHHEHAENSRMWTISKYENMVSLRNSLLKKVREISPRYYYSLDSDVLLINPNTIQFLISHIQDGADAVNTLMFMTPVGTMYPSVMDWLDDGSGRGYRKEKYDLSTYFKSDVIMAGKMMSEQAYRNIDYKIHPQGEDLGWCDNAKKMGYNLYCASYIYTPHIMGREMLNNFLSKGDSRGLLAVGQE